MVDKKASREDKKLVNKFGGNKKGCTFAIERWLDLNVRLFPPVGFGRKGDSRLIYLDG